MKVHKFSNDIEFWYDRHARVWWAVKRDADGNQIGDSVQSATRHGILYAIRTVLANDTTKGGQS